MMYKSLGTRLKHALDIRCISQKDFAKRIGVTECTISRYVNDERLPKADMVVVICRNLGISSDWLLGLM